MADCSVLDDAHAHQLELIEGISTPHKVNPWGCFGYFQIQCRAKNKSGQSFWNEGGGKDSEIPSASRDRQLEVARRCWKLKYQRVSALGHIPEDYGDVYCAWNIGEKTAAWCLSNPNQTIPGWVSALAGNQCWGSVPSDTGAQTIAKCRGYWATGKSNVSLPHTVNAATGKPDTENIAPAADSQQGHAPRSMTGHFGGIIRLYLTDANIGNPVWTTQWLDKCPSSLFYVPHDIGLNGTDSFINKNGDVGMLRTADETPLIPCVLLGNTMYVFQPLVMS